MLETQAIPSGISSAYLPLRLFGGGGPEVEPVADVSDPELLADRVFLDAFGEDPVAATTSDAGPFRAVAAGSLAVRTAAGESTGSEATSFLAGLGDGALVDRAAVGAVAGSTDAGTFVDAGTVGLTDPAATGSFAGSASMDPRTWANPKT